MEQLAFPVVSFLGNFFPHWTVQKPGGGFSSYAASLLKGHKGEWSFDEKWKMPYGHPIRAGWIHAIHSAQQTLQGGAGLRCPILVLSSDRSVFEGREWEEAYRSADIVLDVHDIQTYGRELGAHVTCDTIPGGVHDLILSAPAIRQQVYQKLFDWLAQQTGM